MRLKASHLAMMSVLLLTGCGLTLGPRVESRVVIARGTDANGTPVKIGVISENVRVKVRAETVKGEIVEQELDVGGWSISPPAENK